MSEKINKKPKSKGLWARLAALMVVLLMTTTQNTLMGQDDGGAKAKPITTEKDLRSAISAGVDVTLGGNISLEMGTLSVTKTVTLDLKGYTLSVANGYSFSVITINNGVKLTLKGAKEGSKITGGSGTSITTNGITATYGGGVYVASGSFIMESGTITGNTATYGGGVYVASGGSVSFPDKSTAKIKDNTMPDGTTLSNLYLSSGRVATCDNGFDNNAIIWVTTEDKPGEDSVQVTGSCNEACIGHFKSDEGYAVALEGDYVVFKAVKVYNNTTEVGYATLSDAITNAADNNQLEMRADLTETVTITGKTVTLNLNGYELSGTGSVITVGAKGNLTLTDSSNGNGTITGGTIGVYVTGTDKNNRSTFTMTGGAITGSTTCGVSVGNYGDFTMSGGEISSSNYGVQVNSSSASFAMSGGTITGNTTCGVDFQSGAVTLSGKARIKDNIGSNLYLASGKTVTIGNLTTGDDGAKIGVTHSNGAGTVGTTNNSQYLGCFTSDVEGYVVVHEDGAIKIKKYVAKILNIGYFTTVQEAINAASGGQTVQMIADSKETIDAIKNKTVTLDLNGFTLTGNSNNSPVIQVGNNGNLTLTDDSGSGGGKITNGLAGVLVNAGTFNMKGGWITGNVNYGVNFQNGNVTLGGTAKITGNTKGNLYLAKTRTVTIDNNNGLSSGAIIGVTTQEEITGGNSVAITADDTPDYSEYFSSDEGHGIAYENHRVVLKNTAMIGAQYYGTVKAAITAATSGNTVKMIANSTEETVTVEGNNDGDKIVTLNLNGFTLTGSNSNSAVITVSYKNGKGAGKLILTDESSSGSGKIKGGSTGVRVNGDKKSKSTFTMIGGTITGSTTNGVSVGDYGDFTMEGGTITGETIGVSVTGKDNSNRSTFTMKGGTISGNSNTAANGTGGGVYVGGNGNFEMSAGEIKNNSAATGGGVYVDANAGTVTLSGTAKITGNTGGNLYLNNKTVTIGTLTTGDDGAKIGVTLADFVGTVAENTDEKYLDCFTSDDGLSVSYNKEKRYIFIKRVGCAIIVGDETEYTTVGDAIAVASGQTVQMIANSRENLTISETVTLDLNGCTLTGTGTTSVITVNSGGKLTLKDSGSGGKVTGGSGTLVSKKTYGGGVYVKENGTFEMIGGTISGNTADIGDGVYAGGTVNLGGTAKITGNTGSNLYLPSGKTVSYSNTTSLVTGAQIGVTTATKPGDKTPVAVTDPGNTDCSGYFVSDENYLVYNGSGNVVMLKKIGDNVVQFEGTEAVFGTLTGAINSEDADKYTIKLLVDIKEDIQTITKKITINLNGFSLTSDKNAAVISIGDNGDLTLVNNDGTISGGSNVGVSVNGNSASFTMNGGAITGTTGVQVSAGAFTMNGGIITNCFTGVQVSAGAFTMNGGLITNSINCGVDFQNGNVTLGGIAKIYDNAKIAGTQCNLKLADGKTVAIATDGNKLTGDAEIWVTLDGGTGEFTSNGSETDVLYFASDNLSYYDKYDDNNNGFLKITGEGGVETLTGELKESCSSDRYNIKGTVTIPSGISVTGEICNSSPRIFTIEDGGQLITDIPVRATVKKDIIAATASAKGGEYEYDVNHWYLICSPVQNQYINDVIGLPSPGVNEYDLYRLNKKGTVWENYEYGNDNVHNEDFWVGLGTCQFKFDSVYLYASRYEKVLEFKGTVNHDVLPVDMSIHEGYNLVGNPYTQNVKLLDDPYFYRLNGDGTWQTPTLAEDYIIKPMEGVLFVADEESKITLTATTAKGQQKRDSESSDYIEISVVNSQYNDRAYAMFGGKGHLTKIGHLSDEAPMLYIPQDGGDYAIASMGESTKEFALSFEAKTTSKFVISMNSNRSYTYLHLIDHETGADIDMLANSEYEFIGSPDDSKDRFTVRLEETSDEATEQHFAYQVGSELVVSGEGTLQVFDVLGRVVLSEEVNGSTRVSVSGLRTGAYIVRIIGNDIKTQKVIIR